MVELWREELLDAVIEMDASLKAGRPPDSWVGSSFSFACAAHLAGQPLLRLSGCCMRMPLHCNPRRFPIHLQIKSMDAEAVLLLGHSRESVKNMPILHLLKPLGEPGSFPAHAVQDSCCLSVDCCRAWDKGWPGCFDNVLSVCLGVHMPSPPHACSFPSAVLIARAEYRLSHNARCEDFLGIKRSQLKHTADASVSEKQVRCAGGGRPAAVGQRLQAPASAEVPLERSCPFNLCVLFTRPAF